MGTPFSTERSPLFSTACLPRHRSYQATLYGLNGLAGMAVHPTPPLHALSRTLFVLHSFLLFLILSILLSSLNSHAFPFPSVFPSLLLLLCDVLFIVCHLFLHVMAPTVPALFFIMLSHHLFLSLLSPFQSHVAMTILCLPYSHSMQEFPFSVHLCGLNETIAGVIVHPCECVCVNASVYVRQSVCPA